MAAIGLITAVIGIVLWILKYMTGPEAKERKRQEEKRAWDEAIRKSDTVSMSALLSEQHDRLRKDTDNPGQPPVDTVPK